ncbi:MAG: hypothetical protein EOO16_18425 [Chitinophagaceae bacterium]|nr:MAG: hypothetical protein EOO16_18425 [Chitinophagaceae bacterium]
MKKFSMLLLLALPATGFAQTKPQGKKAPRARQTVAGKPVRKIIDGDTIYVQPAPAREMKVIDGDTIYMEPAPAPKRRKTRS